VDEFLVDVGGEPLGDAGAFGSLDEEAGEGAGGPDGGEGDDRAGDAYAPVAVIEEEQAVDQQIADADENGGDQGDGGFEEAVGGGDEEADQDGDEGGDPLGRMPPEFAGHDGVEDQSVDDDAGAVGLDGGGEEVDAAAGDP